MHKDRRKTGYIEFIDHKGLTAKAIKAKQITTQITEITRSLEQELHGLNIRLIRNPTTVVNRSHFSHLSEILKQSIDMWNLVDYPFVDQLLIRTSIFDPLARFSLPNIIIPLDPDSIVDVLEANMDKLNNPDQILLHPRLSNEKLEKLMYGARFLAGSTKNIIDIGGMGIHHIYDLEKAESVYRGSLNDKIEIDHVAGKPSEQIIHILKKLLKASSIINPVATKIMVTPEKHHKNVVFEYRVVEKDSILYLDFNDFEVI